MTIKDLLQEITNVTREGQILPPSFWLDKAFLIVALWPQLKDDLTLAEMAYKHEISLLIEDGVAVSRAEFAIKGLSASYKNYCALKARDEIVEHTINLCKLRARTEDPQTMTM